MPPLPPPPRPSHPQLFGIDWALGPWSGPLTCRVMATNSAFALELAEKGAVELLAKGLTQADCWKPSADKPLSVRGAFDACKALLYIVMLPKAKALERVKTAKAGVLETMATFRAEFEHELFFDPDFAQPVEGICGQLRQEEEEEGRDASGDQCAPLSRLLRRPLALSRLAFSRPCARPSLPAWHPERNFRAISK